MKRPADCKRHLSPLVLAALLMLAPRPAWSAVLNIAWDEAPDVQSYLISWGVAAGQYGTPLEIVPAQGDAELGGDGKYHIRLSGLAAQQTYYVSARAVDADGLQSPPCPEVAATTYSDGDGDGISDSWEAAYGLNPDSAPDAALDGDGDGFTSLQEYSGGSDPTDSSSLPLLRIASEGDISYSLVTSVSPEGAGSLSPSSGFFTSGSSVSITATAGAGYEFDHWGGDASGTVNPLTITMNSSKNVFAYFRTASVPGTHFPKPAPQPAWVDFTGALQICAVGADPGDEVAAFDPQGVLCGQCSVTTAGYYGWLHVYGDDPDTPEDEGATAGDLITFKVWDADAQRESTAHPVAIPGQEPPSWTQNGDQAEVDLESYCGQDIPLHQGWNLVSFSSDTCYYTSPDPPGVPMLPGIQYQKVSSIAEVLATIAGKYERVRGFDQDGAHTYDPTVPDYINDLTYLAPGYGYWVKAAQDCTLSTTGNVVSAQIALALHQGWNLVGCWADRVRYYGQPPQVDFASSGTSPPFEEAAARADLFPGLAGGSYDVIRSCDIEGAHTYDPALPDYINDLYYVGPGYGYWVKMKSDGTLSY